MSKKWYSHIETSVNEEEKQKCDAARGECSPPRTLIYFFFVLGVIASLSFRIIVILQRVAPAWVRPVWYVGAVGFLIFFLYQFSVTRKRKQAIEKYQLIEKLRTNSCLYAEDREAALELLTSVDRSLEKYNFIIISILSVAAVVLDIIINLPGK